MSKLDDLCKDGASREEAYAAAIEEIESLRQQLKDARRTAEYWKAEHLAGNELLSDRQKQVVMLREVLDALVQLNPCLWSHEKAQAVLAATEPKEQGK